MDQLTSDVVNRMNSVMEIAVVLIEQCNQAIEGEAPLLAGHFQRLRDSLAVLPPNPPADCWYRNTVADCEQLSAEGLHKLARRQLVQLVRRLRSERTEWLREVPPIQRRRVPLKS